MILFAGKSPRENKYVGKLSVGQPLVPPAPHSSEMADFRSSLPISELKENILKEIEINRVRVNHFFCWGTLEAINKIILECLAYVFECHVVSTNAG